MQPKQSLVTRVALLAVMLALMAAVGQASEQNVQKYAWSFPWEATVGRALFVRAEPRDVGGVVLHTLRVSDEAGRQLYEYEGTQLLGAVPLCVGPNGDETLLVTRWSAGNRTTGIIVLRSQGSQVTVVGDLLVASDDFSLLDVDGDGYQEILTFTQDEAPGRSMAEWPLLLEAYRWTGRKLELLGRVPDAEANRALARLFIRSKTTHAGHR